MFYYFNHALIVKHVAQHLLFLNHYIHKVGLACVILLRQPSEGGYIVVIKGWHDLQRYSGSGIKTMFA